MKPTHTNPSPEVYERALQYWPYKESVRRVVEVVCRDAKNGDQVLDLMCGTGYLLRGISAHKRNLSLTGVDIDEKNIKYARRIYPEIKFHVGDVLTWQPKPADKKFDVVLCTGALHHIPYDRQEEVVEKIARLTKPKGFAIISDAYIGNYNNETERVMEAGKLGYEYLKQTFLNGAPAEVVSATFDIMADDVMGREFKTSLRRRLPILKKHFGKIETYQTWPHNPMVHFDYGDFYHILREPKGEGARK